MAVPGRLILHEVIGGIVKRRIAVIGTSAHADAAGNGEGAVVADVHNPGPGGGEDTGVVHLHVP